MSSKARQCDSIRDCTDRIRHLTVRLGGGEFKEIPVDSLSPHGSL